MVTTTTTPDFLYTGTTPIDKVKITLKVLERDPESDSDMPIKDSEGNEIDIPPLEPMPASGGGIRIRAKVFLEGPLQ